MGLLWLFTSGFGIGLLGGMSPGPDTVLVLRAVARAGFRGGAQCALGIGTGLTVHSLLTVALVFAFQSTAPGLLHALQLLGAAYLTYLAAALLRSRPSSQVASPGGEPAGPARHHFLQGLVTNLLNPKVVVFYLAVVAQVLERTRGPLDVGIFLFTLALGPTVWFVLLSLAASRLTRWLDARRRRAIDVVAGLVFLVVAAMGFWGGLRGLFA